MRRTKEDAELTRLLIMKKGLKLFADQGVTGTTLNDIARAAGCTRGAIYWHFKNKWDLFDAICEFYSRPFKTISDASLADDEHDPLGKLKLLLVGLLSKVEKDRCFRQMMIMFIRESSGLKPGMTPKPVIKFMNYQHERRMAVFRNAVRRGQLPADTHLEVASFMVKSMIDGVITSWLQNTYRFSLSDSAENLVDAILNVLGTVKAGEAV